MAILNSLDALQSMMVHLIIVDFRQDKSSMRKGKLRVCEKILPADLEVSSLAHGWPLCKLGKCQLHTPTKLHVY